MCEALKSVGRSALPERDPNGHKGTFGTVLVLGGQVTMPGAVAMVARAAFRSGAGLVKMASEERVLATALVVEPSATGVVLTGEASERLAAVERADPSGGAVLAVGPGLGEGDIERDVVRGLWSGERRGVLDADGLNRLSELGPKGIGASRGPDQWVFTPHPGEFRRLAAAWKLGLDDSDAVDPNCRSQAAARLSTAIGGVVVLKGPQTVVSDGQRIYVNETGHSAMATAGTGDVLTGVIAALMAQGLAPFDAATAGVWAHGRAGEVWVREHGRVGLLARELADTLPGVIGQH